MKVGLKLRPWVLEGVENSPYWREGSLWFGVWEGLSWRAWTSFVVQFSIQVPHNDLVLTLLYVTLHEEFLKLPCVFFNTHVALLKGMEFGVIALKVRGREELTFELGLHLLLIPYLWLPPFCYLLDHVSHHKEAYFHSFRATNFTLLSWGTSLYSNTLSIIWSHSSNSPAPNSL